jgi:hypothetical protein
MIIDIWKLNKTKGGTNFSYPNKAEDAIQNAVCYYYDLQANGGTVGLNPAYDKLINHTKVELKITSSKSFYLEITKGDGTLSGIFTSEADIYIVVGPGKDNGANIIKVKVYNKMLLERWAKHMLANHPDKLKIYPADSMGPGSLGFMLDYDAVEDLYILGFEYHKDASGHIIFDTHDVILPSEFAKMNIRNFIK